MPSPFFRLLGTVHRLPKLTPIETDDSRALQLLLDARDTTEFSKLRKRLEEASQKKFQITHMRVYEVCDRGEEVDVQVAVQVKGYTITWYFWAENAKDLYSQAFRDVFYNAAGKCHKKVENGCDLYYRGSNAFHIKTMHTQETEDNYNHNHYRMKDAKPVTPKDFREHMQAFKELEEHDTFFMPGEVDALCTEFDAFYAKWTHKDESSGISPAEVYMSEPLQRLTTADLIEFNMFGLQQEPCRINASELKVDYEAARAAIERSIVSGNPSELVLAQAKIDAEYQALLAFRKIGGSRGLDSGRAMTRQIEGSDLPVIDTVEIKDDALGIRVPDIPEWALSAKKAVETMQKKMSELEEATPTFSLSVSEAATGMAESATASPSGAGGGLFSVPESEALSDALGRGVLLDSEQSLAGSGITEERPGEASKAVPKIEGSTTPSVLKSRGVFFKQSEGASSGPDSAIETGVAPSESDPAKKFTKGGA